MIPDLWSPLAFNNRSWAIRKQSLSNDHLPLEKNKEIDFWLVKQPAFIEAPGFAEIKAKCPQPSAAIISTNSDFITWLKLRLEYVARGEFEAPSDTISEPLASLEAVS